MESENNSVKSKSISRKKKIHNNSNDLEIDPKVTPINVSELEQIQRDQLIVIAEEKAVDFAENLSKQELIYNILKKQSEKNGAIIAGGVLTVVEDGFGFLRSNKLVPGPSDVYVSQSQIRKLGLRSGDYVVGLVRSPKDQEKYYGLLRVERVNDMTSEEAKRRPNFEDLTPIFPDEKITLETDKPNDSLSQRIVDIFSPVGKGQRALVVSPPKAGKTIILQNIADSIAKNHPECYLMVLLIDERPEEVTDMQRSVKGEVISSTFDEPASRHVAVAEMVIEKAKRLTEHKKDVIILLDSITRLGRAYNAVVPSSGKVLTGGVDANALQRPKRFFGAARNIEQGGSLTIISTALIDTGSRMDEVIFEEFKGTGNSELILDRKVADKRIYPAIDITRSGTRREELLFKKEDLTKVNVLRRIISPMGTMDGIEFLMSKLKNTKNNADFFDSMNKTN